MDIYELNKNQDIIDTFINQCLSEVIPSALKYKLFSLNDGNLFTKSNEVKELSKEERDEFVAGLKDEFIRRFGGY
nr:MAG TPA: hypothetical protein [Caudoviricetes sp.]